MALTKDGKKPLIFIPDISVFQDAFNPDQNTLQQKTARAFFNRLAKVNAINDTVLMRLPIELIVKLMSETWMKNVWDEFSIILKQEPEAKTQADCSCEEAVIDLYDFMKEYKNPICVSNTPKKEYQDRLIPVMDTNTLMAISNEIPELNPKK